MKAALTQTYKTILFDLDGTLIDSRIGITNSIRYSLNKMNIGAMKEETLLKFIGPPLQESFRLYCGFEANRLEAAVQYYREYYSERGIFENTVYEGIRELLEELQRHKVKTFVATSKPTTYARRICDYYGMSEYFTQIEGSELNGTRTDKTELLHYIVNTYGIIKEQAIMIGDREHDIRGANNNQIVSIGVGYGYGSREELEESGASYNVEDQKELIDLLVGQNAFSYRA